MHAFGLGKGRFLRYFEALAAAALPFALDLALGGGPGPGLARAVPYAAVAPLLALLSSPGPALAAAAAATALWAAPAIVRGSGAGFAFAAWSGPAAAFGLSWSLALGISFAKNRLAESKRRLLGRFRTALSRNASLAHQNEALVRVNAVLEQRITGQRDAITLLHDRVRGLSSLNKERALATLLETAADFTRMQSGSIWAPGDESGSLEPISVYGWPHASPGDMAEDADSSIVGYVYRNGRPYSMRMLLEGMEFDRFDTSETVMALPVMIGAKAWAVLRIEELPFERYSRYTETLLAILLSLAEPYLKAIVEYEALSSRLETDGDTGYPLISSLYKTLDRELAQVGLGAGHVSLIVMELLNYDALARSVGAKGTKAALAAVKTHLERRRAGAIAAFHFAEDSQLALLVRDLDQDGASFFCLDALAAVAELQAGGDAPPLELIIGFSSSAQGHADSASMAAAAEHLLALQRL